MNKDNKVLSLYNTKFDKDTTTSTENTKKKRMDLDSILRLGKKLGIDRDVCSKFFNFWEFKGWDDIGNIENKLIGFNNNNLNYRPTKKDNSPTWVNEYLQELTEAGL